MNGGSPQRRERRTLSIGRVNLRETGLAVLFLAPSLVIFVVFFFWPFVRLIGWGGYEPVKSGTSYRWVGWSRWVDVLGSAEFRHGLRVSLLTVLYSVPPGLVLGTLLAVAAHRKLKGIRFFQTVFSSTIATSVAVASVIFYVLINPEIGVFKVDWLGSTTAALPAISLVTIWKNLGLSFVIVLAGLQAVPDELMEAATIDGWGPVRRFFRITLPLLRPVLTFLLIVLVIGALQEFAPADILTSGGPGDATESLLFKTYFSQAPEKITTGAILAVGLFIVTVVVTALQFTLLERRSRDVG